MRLFVGYALLFIFTWMSTGRGSFFAEQLHASDLEDEIEAELAEELADDAEDDTEDDTEDDVEADAEDDTEEDSSDDILDAAPSDAFESDPLEDDSQNDAFESDTSASSDGKKTIAYIYLFPDSYALKSAKGVARETAMHLTDDLNYDYLSFTTNLFQSGASASKRDYDRGLKRFEEAKKLYADLDMEAAIPKFKSAERIIAKHVDKMSDLTILSEILLYLGASYKMFDEDDKASPYFLRYISMNPNKEFDESAFAPNIAEYYQQIKDDFLMMPNGSIVFESTPTGAEVFLDGRLVGLAPMRIDGITTGDHYYRIHLDGYRDRGGDVSVKERRKSEINEELSVYTDVAFLPDAKEAMIDEFGHLYMLKKGIDIAKAFNVDRLLVSLISVEQDTVIVENRLFNPETRSFKEGKTSFPLPQGGDFTRAPELHDVLNTMLNSNDGYTALTSVLDESSTAALLGLDDDSKTDGKKKKKSKAWIVWTIVGVVVAGTAVGLGLGLGLKSDGSDAGGAKLKLTFGQ